MSMSMPKRAADSVKLFSRVKKVERISCSATILLVNIKIEEFCVAMAEFYQETLMVKAEMFDGNNAYGVLKVCSCSLRQSTKTYSNLRVEFEFIIFFSQFPTEMAQASRPIWNGRIQQKIAANQFRPQLGKLWANGPRDFHRSNKEFPIERRCHDCWEEMVRHLRRMAKQRW